MSREFICLQCLSGFIDGWKRRFRPTAAVIDFNSRESLSHNNNDTNSENKNMNQEKQPF